jgi:hypothetical protein
VQIPTEPYGILFSNSLAQTEEFWVRIPGSIACRSRMPASLRGWLVGCGWAWGVRTLVSYRLLYG